MPLLREVAERRAMLRVTVHGEVSHAKEYPSHHVVSYLKIRNITECLDAS